MNKDMEVKLKTLQNKFEQYKQFEDAVIEEIGCKIPGLEVEFFEGTLYAETQRFSQQEKIKEIILMYAEPNTRVIVSNMNPRSWDGESEYLQSAFDIVPADEKVSDTEFWGLADWEEKQLAEKEGL
tara:strand:- start:7 stop:384 length:378 start_codon:yes stop_codon:yes gene_type:complete